MKKTILAVMALLVTLAVPQFAGAAVITDSLGNTAPGFADGAVPGAVAVGAAQVGQPAPFDQALGSDVLSNATGSWTHNFAAIADPILSATLDIGIVEHDSAAAGDQVLLFSVDGDDQTVALNALFNGSGGSDGEYNVYQVDLFALGLSALLTDGVADFVLNLTGPGLQTCLVFLPGCPQPPDPPLLTTDFNGANYIFSTLSITTQDPAQVPVPAPATVVLLGVGLLGIGAARRRG